MRYLFFLLAPYPDANLWLLSPRIDVTFTRSLFTSVLLQYSS